MINGVEDASASMVRTFGLDVSMTLGTGEGAEAGDPNATFSGMTATQHKLTLSKLESAMRSKVQVGRGRGISGDRGDRGDRGGKGKATPQQQQRKKKPPPPRGGKAKFEAEQKKKEEARQAREQAKAPTVPAFASWRVIIQPASVFAELARLSAADNLVFVSPLELGLLAKIHLAGAAEGGA